MLRRLGSTVASRLSTPLASGGLARTVAPALTTQTRGMSLVPTVTTNSGAVIPVDKYFDGESLMEHQARVRHDNPANRTFNYTMVGGARFIGASAARLPCHGAAC